LLQNGVAADCVHNYMKRERKSDVLARFTTGAIAVAVSHTPKELIGQSAVWMVFYSLPHSPETWLETWSLLKPTHCHVFSTDADYAAIQGALAARQVEASIVTRLLRHIAHQVSPTTAGPQLVLLPIQALEKHLDMSAADVKELLVQIACHPHAPFRLLDGNATCYSIYGSRCACHVPPPCHTLHGTGTCA
jgi:hypothetical protein